MGSEGEPRLLSDLKLEIVGEPEIIVPAAPTDNAPVFLSNIDQVVVIPVETIYFYRANVTKGVDKLVDTLRDSLAKVLVPYHFMAGRLSMNAAEQRLQIDCNRAGAQFTHYTSGVSLADLGDVTLPNPAFRGLVPTKFNNAAVVFELPLLAIQVTTFKCGAYTVGVMMNHSLFDGPGAIDFFLNYTALARGEELYCEPYYDRTALKARDPPVVSYEHPEFFKLADMVGSSPFTTAEAAGAEVVALQNDVSFSTKVFPFSAEMINCLKKKALEGGVVKRVSTFEVVAAHIWLARTKSVELVPGVPTNLLFAVDIRRRMKPPLPKHFAGNGVFSSCARATPEEVMNMSFVEAVRMIQKAIERVTDDYVRSSIDFGQIHRGVPALMGGFFLSAWWKMPFYELDYGWGKPIYAGPIVTPLIEFVLLLSNGTQDGGLNLVIALKPEQMAKFEEFVRVE